MMRRQFYSMCLLGVTSVVGSPKGPVTSLAVGFDSLYSTKYVFEVGLKSKLETVGFPRTSMPLLCHCVSLARQFRTAEPLV